MVLLDIDMPATCNECFYHALFNDNAYGCIISPFDCDPLYGMHMINPDVVYTSRPEWCPIYPLSLYRKGS